ncbi:MAG: hypothetical protein AB1422_03555 [bacterium]
MEIINFLDNWAKWSCKKTNFRNRSPQRHRDAEKKIKIYGR